MSLQTKGLRPVSMDTAISAKAKGISFFTWRELDHPQMKIL